MRIVANDFENNIHKELPVITPAQQQQVDAAMQQLSDYIAQPPWEEWMVEVFTNAIDYAAEMLDITADEVLDYLEEQPLDQIAHAHVFEHFVNTETNEDGETVIQAFLRHYAQQAQCQPFALQYLTALSKAELALWEVVSFKAGKSAAVRRFGTQEAVIHVPMDVESLPRNMCIAARMLTLPEGLQTFGFGLLPVERTDAEDLTAYLAQVRAEMQETAANEVPHEMADVEAAISEEMVDLLFHETLAAWIGQGFEE